MQKTNKSINQMLDLLISLYLLLFFFFAISARMAFVTAKLSILKANDTVNSQFFMSDSWISVSSDSLNTDFTAQERSEETQTEPRCLCQHRDEYKAVRCQTSDVCRRPLTPGSTNQSTGQMSGEWPHQSDAQGQRDTRITDPQTERIHNQPQTHHSLTDLTYDSASFTYVITYVAPGLKGQYSYYYWSESLLCKNKLGFISGWTIPSLYINL